MSHRASGRRLRAAIVVLGAGVLAGLSCSGRVEFTETTSTLCTGDSDCPLSTLHCDPGSGQCVACTADAQCLALGLGLARCDSTTHRCIGCFTAPDCATGLVCSSSHCVTPCTGTTICPASAPHCEGDVGFCVACDESGTISEDGLPACGTTGTSGPICNRAIGQCVACLVDSSCGGSTPRCNTYAGKCVACLSSADCTTAAAPVCDPVSNQCVP